MREQKIYQINVRDAPWERYLPLQTRSQVVAKVTCVSFELKPPRLVHLRLNPISQDGEGRVLDDSFSFKYHDVQGVVDFLILKQHYDEAMRRNWQVSSLPVTSGEFEFR